MEYKVFWKRVLFHIISIAVVVPIMIINSFHTFGPSGDQIILFFLYLIIFIVWIYFILQEIIKRILITDEGVVEKGLGWQKIIPWTGIIGYSVNTQSGHSDLAYRTEEIRITGIMDFVVRKSKSIPIWTYTTSSRKAN